MRLGDLDALKEAIRKRLGISSLKYLTEQEKVIVEEIDNAPTVKFSLMSADETKEDAYKRGYERGMVRGILKANERPQGEWIIKPKENSQSAILICNKCNHFIPITIDKNYCPNCGADMRGRST